MFVQIFPPAFLVTKPFLLLITAACGLLTWSALENSSLPRHAILSHENLADSMLPALTQMPGNSSPAEPSTASWRSTFHVSTDFAGDFHWTYLWNFASDQLLGIKGARLDTTPLTIHRDSMSAIKILTSLLLPVLFCLTYQLFSILNSNITCKKYADNPSLNCYRLEIHMIGGDDVHNSGSILHIISHDTRCLLFCSHHR